MWFVKWPIESKLHHKIYLFILDYKLLFQQNSSTSGASSSIVDSSSDSDTDDCDEELEKLSKLNDQLLADIEILTLSTATLLDPVYSVATSHVTERLAEIFTEDVNQIVDLVLSVEDSDQKIQLIRKTIEKLNNLKMTVDMNTQLMVLSSLFI